MTDERIPTLEALQLRASALALVRAFFTERGYLEVESPILNQHAAMEPHLRSFETTLYSADGQQHTRYLQTSPEYALKRVLGAHPGSHVFDIARVFRNEEGSTTHHPEFTLIEWYRSHQDYRYMIAETEALVRAVARAHAPRWPVLCWNGIENDLEEPFERLSVVEAFARYADIDLVACRGAEQLRCAARSAGCLVDESWSWEDTFHLVLLERVEPHLGRRQPTFLYDYPESLASLARLSERRGGDGASYQVGERFELYLCGMELCNGFSELIDTAEQRARFEAEQVQRAALGKPVHGLDESLLESLRSMAPCTGNALGLDRLLMVISDTPTIQALVVS